MKRLSLLVVPFLLGASPVFADQAPELAIPANATACVVFGNYSPGSNPASPAIDVNYSCDGAPTTVTTSYADPGATISSVLKQFSDAGLHLTSSTAINLFTFTFSR
jgi:hypothetical protein